MSGNKKIPYCKCLGVLIAFLSLPIKELKRRETRVWQIAIGKFSEHSKEEQIELADKKGFSRGWRNAHIQQVSTHKEEILCKAELGQETKAESCCRSLHVCFPVAHSPKIFTHKTIVFKSLLGLSLKHIAR